MEGTLQTTMKDSIRRILGQTVAQASFGPRTPAPRENTLGRWIVVFQKCLRSATKSTERSSFHKSTLSATLIPRNLTPAVVNGVRWQRIRPFSPEAF